MQRPKAQVLLLSVAMKEHLKGFGTREQRCLTPLRACLGKVAVEWTLIPRGHSLNTAPRPIQCTVEVGEGRVGGILVP